MVLTGVGAETIGRLAPKAEFAPLHCGFPNSTCLHKGREPRNQEMNNKCLYFL